LQDIDGRKKRTLLRIGDRGIASHVLLSETATARERVSSFKVQMSGFYELPMEKPSSLFMLLGRFLMIHSIHEYFMASILLSYSSM
jgi:hypothetical protein